ncbi:PSP1 domain protein [Parafrankia sp. EAN1pec]|uniref:PSP1 domain-containing protein n=1 Tax=Parafrankia sp. (strain EAN1pec) TaxID=298653 RepID=UPI0000540932|nr:PSP1 domain protein [Frankia sp. EAN1pec]
MPMMCAVSFSRRGRLYYADPGPYSPRVGDRVLVPTDEGPEVATCVWAPQWVSEDVGGLPVLAGLADEDDLRRDDAARRRRAQARVAARRLVREHGLPMKVVGVDVVPDSNAFTVYFTAENRVDFRALVRDLNRTLSARVQLRQLSARDSAKLQGGIGSCGRDLCCSTFLTDFEPVSVRMAKDQNLSLNPMRISGACGRLMCCLRYEHPLYEEFTAAVPAVGARASTPDGDGRVVAHDVPRQQVTVALDGGGRHACSRADVCGSRKAYEATHAAGPAAPAGTAEAAGMAGPADMAGPAATAEPTGTAEPAGPAGTAGPAPDGGEDGSPDTAGGRSHRRRSRRRTEH